MYSIGDQIVYSVHGVCTVLGIELRPVDRTKVEYYVLEPNDQRGARFYVPTQNQLATSKMRPLLDKAAIDDLLRSNAVPVTNWIPDDNRRKVFYQKLLSGGERGELIRMLYTMRQKKKELDALGKRFHLCDENFLRDAQKMLGSEIAFVMHMQRDEVEHYVQELWSEK